MYTVHLDLLRMIHESTCIAVIVSRRLNNIVCMFQNFGSRELEHKLQLYSIGNLLIKV
jgi:hypothetical protein